MTDPAIQAWIALATALAVFATAGIIHMVSL